MIWLIWTPLVIPAVVALFQAHPSSLRVILSLSGAVIFFAIYVWMAWQNARYLASHVALTRPRGAGRWAPVAAMALLSVTLTQVNGWSWGGLFIFTGACVSGWLEAEQAVRVLVTLLLVVLVGGWLSHTSPGLLLNGLVFVAIPSIIVMSMARTVLATRDLRAAHEEITRLAAVTEERLRIARDLHDLLGHNLSLIALKSELAGRLIGTVPDRAAVEMHDIEHVARNALQEVREAVAGYRQPTLASELHNAREILAAAGLAYSAQSDAAVLKELAPEAEATLAWAVREGVTNVIRHSRAHHCAIRVTCDETSARVDVSDDGRRSVLPDATAATGALASARSGHGLCGLAERVEALGGHFQAGTRLEGGFRLTVSVPMVPRAASMRASAASAAEAPARTAAEIATTERADNGEVIAR
jgi:two-component system sensor histidine kinase DesK